MARAGGFLSELLVLVPGLSVRIATRARPALPLERLRLEGQNKIEKNIVK